MPWDIRKTSNGKYDVIRQDTGESMLKERGPYASRTSAEAYMKALYANTPRHHSSPGMAAGGGMVLSDEYQPVFGDAYIDGRKVKREASE